MKQPGHTKVSKHPGRKTGHEPADTMRGRHANVSAPKLVKHMIGSTHTERMTTETKGVGADGHRSTSQVTSGMQGLRPQYTPGMSGMVDGPEGPSAMHPQPKHVPVKTKIHHKKMGSQGMHGAH